MSEQLTLTEFIEQQIIGHRSAALRPIRSPNSIYYRGTLPRVKTQAWVIDKERKVTGDYATLFQTDMGVCLELEYNPRRPELCKNYWQDEINRERNMIWEIETDLTLHKGGQEFVIEAMPIRSEEFATRLPLQVFRDHFQTGPNASMHSHAILLPYAKHKPIPIVIAQNAWQLFRAYYPGWVYLFGNYKGKMLRSSWAVWEQYNDSPQNLRDWLEHATHNKRGRSGLSFSDCVNDHMEMHTAPLTDPITRFNAEIRTSDSTQELDQIIACRALTKALFVRAADLANSGFISLTAEREAEARQIASDIEHSITISYGCAGGDPYIDSSKPKTDFALEDRQGAACGNIAVAFYNEVRPYLTPFEKRCVKSCLIRPVRQRGVVPTD